MTDQLMKPVRYNPEARFEAVEVTRENCAELANLFHGEVTGLNTDFPVLRLPSLDGNLTFNVLPDRFMKDHHRSDLLLMNSKTGAIRKVTWSDFDQSFVWEEE